MNMNSVWLKYQRQNECNLCIFFKVDKFTSWVFKIIVKGFRYWKFIFLYKLFKLLLYNIKLLKHIIKLFLYKIV